MKKKITKFVIIIAMIAMVIGVSPIAKSEEVDAAACDHDWCPKLIENPVGTGYAQKYTTTETQWCRPDAGGYSTIQCACGRIFIDGTEFDEHWGNRVCSNYRTSAPCSTGMIWEIPEGTRSGIGGSLQTYTCVGYHCPKCGADK